MKDKERENAINSINAVISRTRTKIILISVGSFLLCSAVWNLGHEVVIVGGPLGSDWIVFLVAIIYYLIILTSAITFAYPLRFLFTDFRRAGRDAGSDWERLLENSEEFWKRHHEITKWHD
jgi:hypothetical protein